MNQETLKLLNDAFLIFELGELSCSSLRTELSSDGIQQVSTGI